MSMCQRFDFQGKKTGCNQLVLDTPPEHVTLTLTNVCQQRCRFCGVYVGPTTPLRIPHEVIKKMTWLKGCKTLVVTGSGDPLAHPEYVEILTELRRLAPDAKITLYTNGLSLSGDKLDATVASVDHIHISQNAVSPDVYNAIIHRGSFHSAMKNLYALSQKKQPHQTVNLSYVALRENADDVYKMIDLCAGYGFTSVQHLEARQPLGNADFLLPAESYENEGYYDFVKITTYAKCKNVKFIHNFRDNVTNQIECFRPFLYLMVYIDRLGRCQVKYCAQCGYANLFVDVEKLHDLDLIWNNQRAQFIRATVNTIERLEENKMCLCCRLVNRWDEKDVSVKKYAALGVPVIDGIPKYFDDLYL